MEAFKHWLRVASSFLVAMQVRMQLVKDLKPVYKKWLELGKIWNIVKMSLFLKLGKQFKATVKRCATPIMHTKWVACNLRETAATRAATASL